MCTGFLISESWLKYFDGDTSEATVTPTTLSDCETVTNLPAAANSPANASRRSSNATPIIDDEVESVHSMDADGFYTSMHTDSGLVRTGSGRPVKLLMTPNSSFRVKGKRASIASVSTIGDISINSVLSQDMSLGPDHSKASTQTIKRRPMPPPPPPRRSSSKGTLELNDSVASDQNSVSSRGHSPSPRANSSMLSDMSDASESRRRRQRKTAIDATRSYPSMCAALSSSDDSSSESNSTSNNKQRGFRIRDIFSSSTLAALGNRISRSRESLPKEDKATKSGVMKPLLPFDMYGHEAPDKSGSGGAKVKPVAPIIKSRPAFSSPSSVSAASPIRHLTCKPVLTPTIMSRLFATTLNNNQKSTNFNNNVHKTPPPPAPKPSPEKRASVTAANELFSANHRPQHDSADDAREKTSTTPVDNKFASTVCPRALNLDDQEIAMADDDDLEAKLIATLARGEDLSDSSSSDDEKRETRALIDAVDRLSFECSPVKSPPRANFRPSFITNSSTPVAKMNGDHQHHNNDNRAHSDDPFVSLANRRRPNMKLDFDRPANDAQYVPMASPLRPRSLTPNSMNGPLFGAKSDLNSAQNRRSWAASDPIGAEMDLRKKQLALRK